MITHVVGLVSDKVDVRYQTYSAKLKCLGLILNTSLIPKLATENKEKPSDAPMKVSRSLGLCEMTKACDTIIARNPITESQRGN